MKHIVSVSLGSSKRDKREEVEFLGEKFVLERQGTDGDMKKFADRFVELDGKVDALGVGGADIYLVMEEKKYAFTQILNIVNQVKTTPVVDGSGLKHTLERQAIEQLGLNGYVNWHKTKVLLVCATDRFGMAQALAKSGAEVVYGDLLYAVGLPIPVRSYKTAKLIANLILPIITRLPFQWVYPTGEKQEKRTPKFTKYFKEADLICGDWHYIRKFMPDDLTGKTILTQTLRKADIELLRNANVSRAITTTPIINGETFATNVMEAMLVAYLEKKPADIQPEEMMEVLAKLGWEPNIIELNIP
ncbi:MAG TPA: hypothetical protein VK171_02285 [Fimbriimonas sp.]|nr:hypothetical protein [Fimbriimonas sp.]